MTVFDYAVIAALVVSVAIGGWRGFAGELLSLITWGLAILAGWMFAEAVGQSAFGGLIADPSLRLAMGFTTVLVLVLLLGGMIRFAIREFIKATGMTPTDRALGFAFGLLRGLAIVVFAVGLAGLTPAPRSDWWQQAVLSPPAEAAVVALKHWLPDDLAKRIRF
jgi:membrane protein required for colicin V production